MSAPTEQLSLHHGGSTDVLQRRLEERHWALSGLVVLLLSPFLVLGSRYVRKILLATVILDIPLQLGTTFFHRQDQSDLGAFRGLIISATTIALAGLYGSWFVAALVGRTAKLRSSFHINLPLTLYVGIVIFSLVVAEDAILSLFEIFLFVQLYLVYLYVANNVRTRQDVLFVVSLLLIGAVLESLAIIALRFSSMETGVLGPFHLYADVFARTGWKRVGGTMGPNQSSAYLSVLIVFAASVFFTNIGRVSKWLAAAVVMLGEIAIILTLSRGGWLGLLVGISILCVVVCRHRGLSLKVPMAVLVVLLLLYLPLSDSIAARLFENDNGAAESRIPLARLAFRIIADHPILGVGSNNFSVAMNGYLTGEFRSQNAFRFIVHNKYLLIWAETGIVGLAAFLAFLFGALRKGWQCWKAHDQLLSPLALGLAAGIAGEMVHMNLDTFRNRPTQQLMWVIAALFVAMHRVLRTQPVSFDPFSSVT